MALSIQRYDDNNNPQGIVGSLRTFHNGHTGGAYEEKLCLQNQDNTKYYTGIRIIPKGPNGALIGSTTNWSIKVIAGTRQPTEKEWGLVDVAQEAVMSNIGSAGNPDSDPKPFWIRVYCPGKTPAQLKTGFKIEVVYNERNI